MSTLLTPFLPRLKDGNEVTLAKASGAWDDSTAKRLSALAKAIDVKADASDIYSVPDPWARIVLFDRALYDPAHYQHQTILGEWRGALALLGLRERLGLLNLSATPVTLGANAGGKPTPFAEILDRVHPGANDLLRPADTWRQFYILGWNAGRQSRPFGLTSPSTFVATGAGYSDALPPREIPWLARSKATNRWLLTDPGAVLSSSERVALAEWVLHLHSALGHTTTQRGGWMLELLRSFAADLGLDRNTPAPAPEKILSAGRGLGMTQGLAALMDLPHKPETRTLSDLVLETDRPGAPTYILIDSEIGGQLGREPKEIVVHRDITLASVEARVVDFKRREEGTFGLQGATDLRWCREDFFFESHLLYEPNAQMSSSASKLAEPFPGCRPIRTEGQPDLRRILIPLREDVMQLFTADFLEQHFSVEWKSDGSAVCRLRLNVHSLSNAAETGEQRVTGSHAVVLSREYPRDLCVRIPTLLPVGIWPNFSFPARPDRWSGYFLYESWYGSTKTEDFIISPPRLLRTSGVQPQQAGTPGALFQVTRMAQFPEYLTCAMSAREARDGYLVKPNGLLLLQAPIVVQPGGNHRAALGIDFGTTGTSIYSSWLDNPNAPPEQMKFQNRFFAVTDYDASVLKDLTRETFIPAQEWSTGKILSIYQGFRDPIAQELLDGHVLFASDNDQRDFISGDRSGIYSDLKWGERRETDAAKGFLTQLCLQSLAELAAQGAGAVDVRYSYPTAFSVPEKVRFNGIWANVLEQLRAATSLTLEENAQGLNNCEAVAATRFFSNAAALGGFNIARGGLTIDIGGGTTDIALWSRDEKGQPALKSHLSVKFAGRDIFLAPIRLKPSILAEIDPTLSRRVAALEYEHSQPDHKAEAYNAQIDALISSRGDSLLKLLPECRDRIDSFLALMSIGLCGIGFYTGLMAGRLAAHGSYAPADLLPVFVGGNGSQLLKWCAVNSFQPGMPIYDNFADCVIAGLQCGNKALKPRVQINSSRKPKEEVAYGLVAPGLGGEHLALTIDDDFIAPLAGERYLLAHGEAGDWSGCPTAEQLRGAPVSVDPALPLFHDFLRAADIQVSPDTLAHIVDRIDGNLLEFGNRARTLVGKGADEKALDPLRKEPLFIMALKLLVQDQVARWEAAHA